MLRVLEAWKAMTVVRVEWMRLRMLIWGWVFLGFGG